MMVRLDRISTNVLDKACGVVVYLGVTLPGGLAVLPPCEAVAAAF